VIAIPIKIQVTDEARAHMAAKGLDNEFPALLEIAEQIFQGARSIEVLLHEDPDVADLRWLVVRVAIDWDTWERARAARDEWYARMNRELPPAFKNQFGLEIERGPG
jgi:hypothetical protein